MSKEKCMVKAPNTYSAENTARVISRALKRGKHPVHLRYKTGNKVLCDLVEYTLSNGQLSKKSIRQAFRAMEV